MSEPEIKAQDVLAASKGMLQKQLYVVFTKPVSGMGPVMAQLSVHLEYQMKLEREGIMFGAGPFWTDDEQKWEGEGMVVIRAKSIAEARAIAAADPMHSSGARSYTVRPWLLNEGTVTLQINYSSGKVNVA
jgi:uncharacterized protein YciI